MGIVLAFAVGYFVGANAGQERYKEVIDAFRAVRESEEFEAFVGAMRSHAGATLDDLAKMVSQEREEPFSPSTLVDRVRSLVNRGAGSED